MLQSEGLDLGDAEERTRHRIQEVGASILEASLAARGSGKEGARLSCPCGVEASFEGYRDKEVQTLASCLARCLIPMRALISPLRAATMTLCKR